MAKRDDLYFLTKEEGLKVVENALKAAGKPLSEEELLKILHWANYTRVMNAFLDAFLEGKIDVVLNEAGEVAFKARESAGEEVLSGHRV
jgi:hypothetical protein